MDLKNTFVPIWSKSQYSYGWWRKWFEFWNIETTLLLQNWVHLKFPSHLSQIHEMYLSAIHYVYNIGLLKKPKTPCVWSWKFEDIFCIKERTLNLEVLNSHDDSIKIQGSFMKLVNSKERMLVRPRFLTRINFINN